MSETPATPTPWHLHDMEHATVCGPDHFALADCNPTRRSYEENGANAAYIVLAVNSHATLLHQRDALVKALEDCPLPSQSAPTGEFYGRFYAWYNGQREAALKVKE